MNNWTPINEKLPEEGTPVLGFSSEWVDEDFNPRGMRECFLNGDGGWISAKWFDYQDTYVNGEGAPEFWMPLPDGPEVQVE